MCNGDGLDRFKGVRENGKRKKREVTGDDYIFNGTEVPDDNKWPWAVRVMPRTDYRKNYHQDVIGQYRHRCPFGPENTFPQKSQCLDQSWTEDTLRSDASK